MAGKRFLAVVFLTAAAFFILLVSSGGATHFKAAYIGDVSPDTPSSKADLVTKLNIAAPYPNFDRVYTGGTPTAFWVHMAPEISLAARVGYIESSTTLATFGGCNLGITVNIPFMNCTTDVRHKAPWVLSGENLVLDCDQDVNEDGSLATEGTTKEHCEDGLDNDLDGDIDYDDSDCIGNCIDTIDNDGNGDIDCADPDCVDEAEDSNAIPTYCDHYPVHLATMYDDAAGNPIQPRARYQGHSIVLAGSPPSQLNFLIFNPGQLQTMGTPPEGTMGDSRGYINVVVLDNPPQATSPSTIADFCTPLATVTTLVDASEGQYAVYPGPAPYESPSASMCYGAGKGVDNDFDGFIDDGCLYIPDPCNGIDDDLDGTVDENCYQPRMENPPAFTGVYGTGSHIALTYIKSQRDADNDGIENQMDPCPYTADNDGDTLTEYIGNTPYGDNNPDGDNITWGDHDATPWDPRAAAATGDNDSDGIPNGCDPTPNGPVQTVPAGCPPGVSGLPDEDQDCFPNRQDNCPLIANGHPYDPNPLNSQGRDQTDADEDGIGAPCDLGGDDTPDGHNHEENVMDAMCIADPYGGDDTDGDGDSDDDDDGWCDSTEVLLGSDKDIGLQCANVIDDDNDGTINDGCPAFGYPETACADAADNDRDGLVNDGCPQVGNDPEENNTPEYMGLAYDGVPGTHICDDYREQDHPDVDPVDNDADGTANDPAHAAPGTPDPGCGCQANDTDCDGVPDTHDNCPNDDNPGQIDSDGDGQGDECDTDDDNDGAPDANEWWIGTDPKDNCPDTSNDPAWPMDFNNNQEVAIGDIIQGYYGKILVDAEYNRRADFNMSGGLEIADIIIGYHPAAATNWLPKSGLSLLDNCRTDLTFTNNTGGAVDDIHIELLTDITHIESATDNQAGTWVCERVPPLCANDVDDDGDTFVNDGCPKVGLTVESGYQCDNDVDDDGDTKVNDGCPKVATNDDPGDDSVINDGCPKVANLGGPAEVACGDGLDNDGDTTVDDGCPKVGAVAESGAECIDSEDHYPDPCRNAIDDDYDLAVNDGCPARGAPEVACANDVDDDGDTRVNDGCPDVGYPETKIPGGGHSYLLNCERQIGTLTNGGILTINLKGKRPPIVRCYDWTLDCEVINSSSKPCRFHNNTGEVVDDLYVEFGWDIDGDTVSDLPGVSYCDNVETPFESIWSFLIHDELAKPFAGVDIVFSTPLPPSSIVEAHWEKPGPWTLQCWAWTDTTLTEGPGMGPCDDGADNDGDTRIDSADPDCWVGPMHGECKYNPALSEDLAGPNTCGDGIDNGTDVVKDLQDPDCYDP